MDFRFDADDRAMISASGESFRRHLPTTRFRSGGSSAAGLRALAADGWLHAGLAQEQGGLGIAAHLVCVSAREAGRVLCVEQWVNNAQVLPRLIAALRDGVERDRWLVHQREHPGFLIADGRSPILRASAPFGPPSTMARWCYGVEQGFDGYLLSASRTGHRLTRISGGVVDLAPIGGLALGVGAVTVHASGTDVVEAELDLGARGLAAIARESLLVHSAALVGVSEEAERLSVEYVKIREQFGQPVGRFQAVKHLLAEVHVHNEIAGNAVLHGALSPLDERGPAVARIQATRAALGATRAMVQLHGGFGFTWEADAHWFLKTALSGVSRFGSPDEHSLALGRGLVA